MQTSEMVKLEENSQVLTVRIAGQRVTQWVGGPERRKVFIMSGIVPHYRVCCRRAPASQGALSRERFVHKLYGGPAIRKKRQDNLELTTRMFPQRLTRILRKRTVESEPPRERGRTKIVVRQAGSLCV